MARIKRVRTDLARYSLRIPFVKANDFQTLPRRSLEILLARMNLGVAIVSSAGTILNANECFCWMLNLHSFSVARQQNLKRYVNPQSWDALAVALARAQREALKADMEIEAFGQKRVLRLKLFPISDAGSRIALVADEVTELLRANEALRATEASLRSLSAHLLHLQDEERRRIARDLHDITGQDLVALDMSLTQIAGEQGNSHRFSASLDLIHKIESDIRTLSYVLHPPLLDEMGLGAALRWYVGSLRKRGTLEIELQCPADLPRFSLEAETCLFRVAQESLTNVLRHSGSRNVEIRVSMDSAILRISVKDRGKGTDIRELEGMQGVGISGMRERLRQLGGGFEIHSDAGGTEVVGTVPIRAIPPADQEATSFDFEQHLSPGAVLPRPSPPSGRAHRILIVDDHEITRQGIRSLLAGELDLEICGEAGDGFDAILEAKRLQPDLIILDLSMPRMGGLSAAYSIHQLVLSTKILIFSYHAYEGLEKLVRAAGCWGFVKKGDASRDLIRAIRAVLGGGEFYGSEAGRAHSA